jgi:LCP family protein required for cell wall assembly
VDSRSKTGNPSEDASLRYKHFAPEDEVRGWPYARVAGLALGGVALLVLCIVGVLSAVQHRSPTDLLASLMIEAPQDHFHKDRIAVALFGIDYNYDSKDQPYSAGARTDTIMALALNFPTKANPRGSVNILSVPRDMDYTFPSGHEDRINAAYSYGKDAVDGAHRSEAAVASFLGIPKFDRFIVLRINAAKELVDAIGGIDVVPDTTMSYDDTWGHLHIHFKKGVKYHMSGDQAVSYSRFRHDECSDPCRIKRQQQVMRLVVKKLSDDKLNDVLHINQLIGVVRRNVVTDVSDREGLSVANAMRDVDLKSVRTDQVPYVGDKELACCGDVILPDDAKKVALVKRFFIDPQVPQVVPGVRAVAAVPKSSIHIEVLNGSGVRGIARKLADQLRKQGFVVDKVGDAKDSDHEATEVHVFSTTPVAGEIVLAALPIKTAVVVPESYLGTPAASGTVSDVTIIVGRDFAPQREASAVK